MSTKEIKSLMHRFIEGVNKGKAAALDVIDELCAADFVLHCARGKDIRGIKKNKQNMSELFTAVPDAHITINDMVAEGDRVATRYTLTGTNKATGKKVTMWMITIDRISGGKFVEEWERYDTYGLMQQFDIVPAPEKH